MSLRAHDRYVVKSLTPAKLVYLKDNAGAEVLLEDVSTHGAGMTMYEEPRIGERISLAFQLGSGAHQVAACVRWSQPSGPRQWLVGCEFNRPIKVSALDGGSLQQVPQRRAISGRAVMRRESAPNHPYSVEVQNCSAGGIGLITNEKFSAGETVMLELSGESFVVRMQWSAVRGGRHAVGCKFDRACDAVRVQDLMGLSQAPPRPAVRPLLGASALTLAGTIIVGLIVFLNGREWPF
jgi:Tfp pilus assembly protein PilZ